jgi:hypothetical protein
MTDRAIAIIPKNAREHIDVRLRTIKGRRVVDIRVYEETGTGRHPSPRGLVVRPDLLEAVLAALAEARSAAQTEGIIPVR